MKCICSVLICCNSPHFVCSVRFGIVGGQMRLLVAAQTGHVFVFDTEGISAETGCKSLTCQRLHMTAAAGNDPPSMPV